MKGMKKALIGLALGAVAALGVVGFAACGAPTETFEGEYHYANAWGGNDYGVKVAVTVNTETNKITKVEILESEYTQLTPSWVESENEHALAYQNGGEDELLGRYVGLTVDQVKAVANMIDVLENGQPQSNNSDGSVNPDFDADTFLVSGTTTSLLYSGATQSSGRIVLAVNNALKDYTPAAE